MNWLGDYPEDYTAVVCMFTTHDTNGAPVAPLSAFEAADIAIYKDGNAAQKTTTNGVTMTSPFDTVTGLHTVTMDTSNDTGDASFWVAGHVYTILLNPDTETVNGQTALKVIGQFGIALASNGGGSAPSAATVAAAVWDLARSGHSTSGTFGEGVASVQGNVTGSVGSVSGAVGSVTGNVGGNVTGSVGSVASGGITASSLASDTITAAKIAADAITAAKVADGTIDAATFATGAITAAAIAADAITDAKVASDVTIASVTGAVGSVTGNVGGNVTGSVGSVASGGITASSLASDTITAAKIAADAITAAKVADGTIDAATFAAGAITASAIASDAITDAKVASDVTIASVTGAVGSVTGNVGGNVTGSIGSLSTQAKADVNAEADTALSDVGLTGTITGRIDAAISTRLAGASYTAPPTANENADALLDRTAGVETSMTIRQAFRIMIAALAGKASGLATTTAKYRDTNDSKDRITATVDADGNRSAVTLDAS